MFCVSVPACQELYGGLPIREALRLYLEKDAGGEEDHQEADAPTPAPAPVQPHPHSQNSNCTDTPHPQLNTQ